jgi:hypothetical protein
VAEAKLHAVFLDTCIRPAFLSMRHPGHGPKRSEQGGSRRLHPGPRKL